VFVYKIHAPLSQKICLLGITILFIMQFVFLGYNVTPMQVCFNQTFKKLHKHEGYQVTTTTVEQIFSSSRYTNKHSLKL